MSTDEITGLIAGTGGTGTDYAPYIATDGIWENDDAGIQWLFLDGDGSLPEVMKVLQCTRLYCIAESVSDNAGRIPDRVLGI